MKPSPKLPSNKDLGVVFTPERVTQFLARWAIRSSDDVTLDPGAGTGQFLLAAADRLAELGSLPGNAANQLHAVEFDDERFRELSVSAQRYLGRRPPHLHHADLFEVEFPNLDAVIGNPPYVIRHRLANPESVRAKVGLRAGQVLMRQQTDLYCYFIMYAASFLKQEGRLALIVSDSWLDMDFGAELKTFLLNNFKLKALIGFDKRVFPDALVKTVVLLAERSSTGRSAQSVHLIQLKNAEALDEIEAYLEAEAPHEDGFRMEIVQQNLLDPRQHWGIYFKEPALFRELSEHRMFTPLGALAETRIGLQTLARKFYVVTSATLREESLEREYFEPVAVSPREIPGPVIGPRTELDHFVLICAQPKTKLSGTGVLKYIREAEEARVPIRTRHEFVTGYHNLPRLMKTGRDPWYDLKTETERRGRYPILVPRRVFRNCCVIWNKRGVIANEDFIEIRPHEKRHIIPLLAALNSSFGEFMIRSVGHVYGGGVCNLNPSDLKNLPVVDIDALDAHGRNALCEAYNSFVERGGKCRSQLDNAVFELLAYSAPDRDRFYRGLDVLRSISTALKEPKNQVASQR